MSYAGSLVDVLVFWARLSPFQVLAIQFVGSLLVLGVVLSWKR